MDILELLLVKQVASGTNEAIRIQFSDYINSTRYYAKMDTHGEVTNINQRIRALQYTFRKLRRAGLLYLEDDEADRHVLLSFEAALKPVLLQMLGDRSRGLSTVDIANAILTQERFKCVPLQWIETSLGNLLASQQIVQRQESGLFFVNSM
ncbi:hypothetical protein PsorP6_000484 [Peronosclerospora sorghi]|uniref:Uncharacterized protein n=1 Tax=Peronosclerospora sorghi TaxID=230839 RepID=A0ACC0WTH7_9STRA|nr:hypothetical protein PsorP6_000484 [Peronosclerospora sorghi]